MDSVGGRRVNIVIPCLNEQDSLPPLLDSITDVCANMDGYLFTAVFVDDGSTDRTWDVVGDLQSEQGLVRVRGVRLAGHHGKAVAQSIGIKESLAASFVVLMDADGQHDPRYLPPMIEMSERTGRPCAGLRSDYKRRLTNQVGVIALQVVTYLLGIDFNPRESEFVVLPGRAASSIASDPHLGVAPLMSVVHSKFETGHFEVSVPPGLVSFRPTRWGTGELWRKGLLHLLADPWRVFPRAAGFVVVISALMLAYGLFVGIKSIIEGTFLGIGSMIVLQTIVFSALSALLLLVWGMSLTAFKARSISSMIISERTKDE